MNAFVSGGIVAAVVSLLGTLMFAWFQRKKVRAEVDRIGADASKVITEAATDAVSLVSEQLKVLRGELVEARSEVAALRRHMEVLEALLRSNGVPAPEFIWRVAGRL